MQRENKKLNKNEQAQGYKNYAQFIKAWRDNPATNVEAYKQMLSELNLEEGLELEYNKLPINVSFKKLPIITDAIAHVKVVVLTQADNFALIMPDNVYDSYEALMNDPTEITPVNMGLQLVVDSDGFDSADPEFQKLVKDAYISANNYSPAFELDGAVKQDAEDKAEEAEEIMAGIDDEEFLNDDFAFDEPDLGFDDEEVAINMEAYKKFDKLTPALDKLIESIKKSPTIVRDNVKLKYIENVLAVEVDNKSIYNAFINVSKKARETLSTFGEMLRTHEGTQLVDTFSKDGRRTFIIAESAGNNFWGVINESVDNSEVGLDENRVVLPEKVIYLNKSSVRKENRKHVLINYKNKKAVYLVGNKK